ncbi:sigma-70 family RNA polymerase sigma factor [Virgibacillus sp. MSP4-1]|uniref:RNA polymerase sigma factor n=1 Tax=Virgibacillus sp. MSP4-1 TaxID=2700081 RepID=UPI0003A4217C|nr:sigma-70 family RNA polymerase sigma factor [Virgibacillus sp. MSP4-1]QHS24380.1 sigma-70 family RNA polymerase sigma factor [Virgibacillus sp. MSP4-1]
MEMSQNKAVYLANLNQRMMDQDVNELYAECKKKIFSIALSYVKDHYLAEDLSHEILVKCYVTREKFKGDCSFHTWMCRIAKNHCIDFLRKSYRSRDLLSEDIDFTYKGNMSSPESEFLRLCDKEELNHHLRRLPATYLEVLTRFYYKEQSLKEIGHHLNLKPSTVKTRLFRARKMLRDQYQV